MSPKIRRLTATFEDPRVEALYVHDVFARTIKPFTRFSVVMTTLVFLSYGVHDLIVVPAIHTYAWTLASGCSGLMRWHSSRSRIRVFTSAFTATRCSRSVSQRMPSSSVNTASRMESHALPGTIQITEDTAKDLEAKYVITPRREIEVKGKGLMKTFFLEGRRQPASS